MADQGGFAIRPETPGVIPPGEHDMWPQVSPWNAERFAPAVLGVPHDEYEGYMDVIVGRYLRSLKTSSTPICASVTGGSRFASSRSSGSRVAYNSSHE